MFWPNCLLLLWFLVVACCSWLLLVVGCLLLVLVGVVVCVCGGVFKIFGPLPRTSSLRTALPLDRPKFRSFFSLPPEISFFLLSLGVFSLNFGGVFEDRGAQMCTFGLSGCRVEPRRPHFFWVRAHPSSPPLRAPTPPGPHPSGPPPLRAPTPSGPHPLGPPPKTKLAKCGLAKFGQQKLAKFGQIRMAKCGQLTLAKYGIGQIRFGQMRPNKDGQIRFAKCGHGQDIAVIPAPEVFHASVLWKGTPLL